MKQVYPKLEDETYEEQHNAQRYNPATVAIYKNIRFTLDCGSSDDTYFYVSSAILHCLSINHRHGYVGLQEFYLKGAYQGQESGNMFLQSSEDIEHVLGRKGLDYSPRTITKILSQHIY